MRFRKALIYSALMLLLIGLMLCLSPSQFRVDGFSTTEDDWQQATPSTTTRIVVPMPKEAALRATITIDPNLDYYYHLRSSKFVSVYATFSQHQKRVGPPLVPNPLFSEVVAALNVEGMTGQYSVELKSGHQSAVEIDAFSIFGVPKWVGALRMAILAAIFLLALRLVAILSNRSLLAAAILFLCSSFVYYNYVLWWNSGDNKRYILTSVSLVNDWDLDISEFTSHLVERPKNGFFKPNGKATLYNYFPLGPSIAALPFVVYGLLTDMGEREVSHLAAATISGLAVALLFLISRQQGLSIRLGVMLSLVFGFASTHLSTNAGDLWSHTVSICIAFGMVYALGFPRSRAILIAGLLAAFGYVVRPDFSLVALGGGAIVLYQRPKQVLAFVVPLFFVIAMFMLVTKSTHGQWLPPYYGAGRLVFTGSSERLLGQLFSPSRGLLFHNPILLLLPLSLVAIWKCPGLNRGLFISMGIVALASIVAISGFPKWWGGYSFGPRLHAGIIGLLYMQLIPIVGWSVQLPLRWRWPLGSIALIAIAAGLLVNASGAITINLPIWKGSPYLVRLWNNNPVSIDSAPERCWDWNDIQFMRRF